ncbi:hypothetical protein B0G73_102397 [Paraburkholderia sp. BL25I1N1]|nr:hypothetical protein B0G73_102397 [Paraburkholderia sp. BL25I1N1]
MPTDRSWPMYRCLLTRLTVATRSMTKEMHARLDAWHTGVKLQDLFIADDNEANTEAFRRIGERPQPLHLRVYWGLLFTFPSVGSWPTTSNGS